MAYEKQTWQCGDVISAEKLNHMEDGIAECCEGGGDCGYSCEMGYRQIFNDSVTTTEDRGFYYTFLPVTPTDPTIRVTLDGTEYDCSKVSDGDSYHYGAPYDSDTQAHDWSVYPFVIYDDGSFHTEAAGTYSLKIEIPAEVVETSECFERAVESITLPFILHVDATTEATPVITVKKFDADVAAALESGEILERSGVAYVDEGDISLMLPLRNISVNEYYGWCELTFSGLNCTFGGDGTISSIFCHSVYAKIDMSDGSLVESHYSGVELYQA